MRSSCYINKRPVRPSVRPSVRPCTIYRHNAFILRNFLSLSLSLCPQGSILGVFLFNATIDDLEEGCPDIKQEKLAEKAEVTWSSTGPIPSTPLRQGASGPAAFDSPIVSPPLKRSRRLDYSIEQRTDLSEEPHDRTEAKWRQTLALLLRYISMSKINLENSYGFQVTGFFSPL